MVLVIWIGKLFAFRFYGIQAPLGIIRVPQLSTATGLRAVNPTIRGVVQPNPGALQRDFHQVICRISKINERRRSASRRCKITLRVELPLVTICEHYGVGTISIGINTSKQRGGPFGLESDPLPILIYEMLVELLVQTTEIVRNLKLLKRHCCA